MNFELTSPPEDIPQDAVPELSDVEYPCQVCGKESGPYGGRGRKPKLCPEHKKQTRTSSPKVTGNLANQAAQATAVLAQLNAAVAVGLSVMSMFKTAGAIVAYDSTFQESAYNALITDPELCKMILKSGAVSGKMMLGLAYAGMGVAVAPVAVMEYREKKDAREAKLNDKSGS